MKKIKLAAIAIASAAILATGCCNSGNKCSSCCETTHAFARKLPVGVQLYSVRTDLEKDFYGTLKAIREMGYAGVEFYGEYYGNSVVQVKKWCTELGLIPFSNHVPFQQMIDDVDKVIEENTILGVQYIVFPYMDEASRPGVDEEQFKATAARIGEVGAKISLASSFSTTTMISSSCLLPTALWAMTTCSAATTEPICRTKSMSAGSAIQARILSNMSQSTPATFRSST